MKISELKETLTNNVPVDVMKHVARENELIYSGSNKIELVDNLVSSATENEKVPVLSNLAIEYQFAGRTSVDWYELEIDGDEPPTLQGLREIIIEKFSTDVFNFGRLRPTLEKDPKLIYVNINESDGQMILMFAYNGPIRRILVDYEPRIDHPTYFDYVMLKFNPLTIEIRANFNMSKKLLNACSTIFDFNIENLKRIEIIGDEQVNELKNKLEAELQLARHQGIVGDYDWIEVLADPETGDLAQSQHYLQELATAPSKRKIFVFEHTYSFGYSEKITLEVNTELGRFWFRSAVGEEAIQHVLRKVRETIDSGES